MVDKPLSSSPAELLIKSLDGLVETFIIVSYETIDGGFRLKLHEDAKNSIDMSLAETRGFCLGAELVHKLATDIFHNNVNIQDVIKEMFGSL